MNMSLLTIYDSLLLIGTVITALGRAVPRRHHSGVPDAMNP